MQPIEIGMAIASTGLLASVLQIIILPIIQQRIGTVAFFRAVMAIWPVHYLFFPFVNAVALLTFKSSDTDSYLTTMNLRGNFALWAAVFVLLMLQRFACMAYPCV